MEPRFAVSYQTTKPLVLCMAHLDQIGWYRLDELDTEGVWSVVSPSILHRACGVSAVCESTQVRLPTTVQIDRTAA
jgi:hypothetical protein